jgi:hypothetical protein
MTKFYRQCKNGKIIKSKDGQWVKRFDYDELIRENRFLKRKLDWKNFTLKFCYLLENDDDIRPEVKLSAQIYLSGLQFLIESSKNTVKDFKNTTKTQENEDI